MKRKDIRTEAERRCEPDFSSEYYNGFFYGFIDGAEWRINSVWHDAIVEAKRNEEILIEDIRGKHTIHKFYLEKWGNMIKIYEIKRWAYVKDLISKTKE